MLKVLLNCIDQKVHQAAGLWDKKRIKQMIQGPKETSQRKKHLYLEMLYQKTEKAEVMGEGLGESVESKRYMCVHAKLLQSCPTLCDAMDYSPPRLVCPWVSPGKNTGVDCLALLQRIFLTQKLNLCLLWLLHCR